jgi:hypothetical protein
MPRKKNAQGAGTIRNAPMAAGRPDIPLDLTRQAGGNPSVLSMAKHRRMYGKGSAQ